MTKRDFHAGKRALSIFVLCTAILATAPGGASATSAADWGPGFKACGHFRAGYTIHVFAKDVTCSKARRIQKDYWLGAPSGHVEVNHGGPVYILLKRFPGWKCFSGAGGGSCTKGRKVAAYSDLDS